MAKIKITKGIFEGQEFEVLGVERKQIGHDGPMKDCWILGNAKWIDIDSEAYELIEEEAQVACTSDL